MYLIPLSPSTPLANMTTLVVPTLYVNSFVEDLSGYIEKHFLGGVPFMMTRVCRMSPHRKGPAWPLILLAYCFQNCLFMQDVTNHSQLALRWEVSLLMLLCLSPVPRRIKQVYANAEEEFHLARARLIQQSWRAVLKGRQPPPLNLLMPVMGLIADVVGAIWEAYKFIARWVACHAEVHGAFRSFAPRGQTHCVLPKPRA